MVKWLLRNNAGGRIENLVYYTIGTGIGAGVIQRGEFYWWCRSP